MRPLLTEELLNDTLKTLSAANKVYTSRHPGFRADRQPVHTVSTGAHRFTLETTRKMGQVALEHLQSYAPDFIDFAHAFRLPGSGGLASSGEIKMALLRAAERNTDSLKTGHSAAWLAATVYKRVINKLRRQPIEDLRIDFADGFGVRSDAEEDREAVRAADEVANGIQEGVLPPFIGIRIKPFSDEYVQRSIRTLDLFVGSLSKATGGQLPDNFVVTLPMVTIPAQVGALSRVISLLEPGAGLTPGSISIELMIETPGAVIGDSGRSHITRIVQAANGRCQAVHFDIHDYSSAIEISAVNQRMSHPACDFARQLMQASLAGTGIWMADGATNIVPVPIHKTPTRGELTSQQQAENREVIHRAWRRSYEDTTRSLESGFYQGRDIHPAQLPARYTAVYSFFLRGLDQASARLQSLIEKAGGANVVGEVLDDAATAEGLLSFFARAVNCGAITMDEAAKSSLTMDELKSRSFMQIVKARATQQAEPKQ
jgi:hypothetical protein